MDGQTEALLRRKGEKNKRVVKQTNVNKNMRKIWLFINMCFVMLVGCSKVPIQKEGGENIPTVSEEHNNTADSNEIFKTNGYVFVYDEMEIEIDMPFEIVLEQLGKAKSYFEAPSCAIDGIIRTYGYGSFELDTYEIDGTEYISCIYFKDDTVSTREGAYLFMPQEELFSIYGEFYTEEAGMIVYCKDNMKLKFIITDGKVSSIQYISLVTEIKQ